MENKLETFNDFRKALGMTQQQVAIALGMHESTIVKIDRGTAAFRPVMRLAMERLLYTMPSIKKVEWREGLKDIWYAVNLDYTIMLNRDPIGIQHLYITRVNLPGVGTNPWDTFEKAAAHVQQRHEAFIRSQLETRK